MTADFTKAFDDFLDRREYDQAESALFSMVRIAFRAGWLAAGGKPPKPQKVVKLVRPHKIISLNVDSLGIDTDINFENESDKDT